MKHKKSRASNKMLNSISPRTAGSNQRAHSTHTIPAKERANERCDDLMHTFYEHSNLYFMHACMYSCPSVRCLSRATDDTACCAHIDSILFCSSLLTAFGSVQFSSVLFESKRLLSCAILHI